MQYIVAYDFGTTGVKTCLFSIDGGIRMEASAYAPYGLYILPDGGAEQDADEWWAASIVRGELSVLHNYILKISINQAEYTNLGHLRRKFCPFSTLFQKNSFFCHSFVIQ